VDKQEMGRAQKPGSRINDLSPLVTLVLKCDDREGVKDFFCFHLLLCILVGRHVAFLCLIIKFILFGPQFSFRGETYALRRKSPGGKWCGPDCSKLAPCAKRHDFNATKPCVKFHPRRFWLSHVAEQHAPALHWHRCSRNRQVHESEMPVWKRDGGTEASPKKKAMATMAVSVPRNHQMRSSAGTTLKPVGPQPTKALSANHCLATGQFVFAVVWGESPPTGPIAPGQLLMRHGRSSNSSSALVPLTSPSPFFGLLFRGFCLVQPKRREANWQLQKSQDLAFRRKALPMWLIAPVPSGQRGPAAALTGASFLPICTSCSACPAGVCRLALLLEMDGQCPCMTQKTKRAQRQA
jgi:hypothetical protein